jgi:hypothetical protein
MSRPVRNSILGRRGRRDETSVMLAEPSISVALDAPDFAAKATEHGKAKARPVAYPDRPMPLAGPRPRKMEETMSQDLAETTDADFRGCRFIEGEPTPLRRGMYCCRPTQLGEAWCPLHSRLVWRRQRNAQAARGEVQ